MNDEPVMRGDLGKIAVAPDTGKPVEIGRVIFRAIRIIPKPDGHRGKRLGADKLALLAHHRLAFVVPDVGGHRQPARLYLAAPHRQQR